MSFAKKEEAKQIEALIRYYAKVEPNTYFEHRNNNDDVVSSEDEVIGNVTNIVNDR